MSANVSTQVTVINPLEGKRYKMALKGDIQRLTIRKFKQYLSASCGIPEAAQILKFNGIVLGDDVMAGEVGLTHGCTLTVEKAAPGATFIASPARHNLELDTLDQQRGSLLSERNRRDEEFRRHHEVITRSITDAERRRRDLEREQQERQQELEHLRDLEERAEAERQRVAALRAAEAERESQRNKDLEARKAQLQAERQAQRQLEMQKLENERKKMLLAQQKAEYEAERARLEREREDYFERKRQQEMEIREREFRLERQQIEAERARRELEMEKIILNEKRAAEFSRVGLAAPPPLALPQPPSISGSAHNTPLPSARGFNMTPRALPPQPSREASVVVQQEEFMYTPQQQQLHAQQAAPRQPSAPQQPTPAAAPATSATAAAATPQRLDVRGNMEANLASLARLVGLTRLVLDDNNTCVVNYQDRYTLLLTFDAATERLYLYSTLTTAIPRDSDRKLRLYEFLLEGALLGRDMCGGGVGASLKNDFILMSTSLLLPECGPSALAAVAPTFVDSLAKWRARLKERGLVDPDDDASRSMLRGDSGVRPQSVPPMAHAQSQPQASPSAAAMYGNNTNAYHQQQQQQQYYPAAPTHSQSQLNSSGAYASLPSGDYRGASSSMRGVGGGGVGGGGAFTSSDAPLSSPLTAPYPPAPAPFIGLEVSDGELVNGYKHQYTTGVLVMAAKGPAHRAGIIPQDFIKSVGGRPITSLDSFRAAIRELRPSESVPFVVERAGSEIVLTVLVSSATLGRDV